MMALAFRAATIADLPFIIRMIDENSVVATSDDPSRPGGPGYTAAFDTITNDPNQTLFVAERDGAAVGTFQLTFIPGISRRGMWRGLIEGVYIDPAHRSKGYGSEMMRFAIEACRARGCGMVQLTSNKKRLDAHRFYRALGFEQSHEGFKLVL